MYWTGIPRAGGEKESLEDGGGGMKKELYSVRLEEEKETEGPEIRGCRK